MEVARVLGEGLSRVAATVRLLVRDALLRPGVGERELSARYAAVNEQLGPQLGATCSGSSTCTCRTSCVTTRSAAPSSATGASPARRK